MKKTKFFLAAGTIAVLLTSCSKEIAVTPAEPEDYQDVVFNVYDDEYTKVTNTTTSGVHNDAAVTEVQFLVFNSDKSISAYGKTTDSKCVIRLSRMRDMSCYALVNFQSDLSTVKTETELIAMRSSLENNTADKIQMIGFRTRVDMTSTTSVTIPVKRIAAKVSLEKITLNFASPALAAKEFKVEAIYLINVQSGVVLDSLDPSNLYINKGRHVNTNYDHICYDVVNEAIANGNTMQTEHFFYCYPNTAADNSDSRPFTRVVVQVKIGSVNYYYPVDIHNTDNNLLEANKHYKVTNLTITGLGSTDPDKIPDIKDVTYSVSVEEWAQGCSKQIEY